jgi:hypothetical protein
MDWKGLIGKSEISIRPQAAAITLRKLWIYTISKFNPDGIKYTRID